MALLQQLQKLQEALVTVTEWDRIQRVVWKKEPLRTLFITIASSDPYPADPSSHESGTTIDPEIFQLTVEWDNIPCDLRCEHIGLGGRSYCDSGKCFWMEASHKDTSEPIWKVKRTGSSKKKQRDYETGVFMKSVQARQKLVAFWKDCDSDMDLVADVRAQIERLLKVA